MSTIAAGPAEAGALEAGPSEAGPREAAPRGAALREPGPAGAGLTACLTDAAGPASHGSPLPSARWLARALIAAGVVMIPWLFVLAAQLPATTRAWHWPAAWVGLDGLEALGLLATGILLARRDGRYRLAAMAAATLLVTDAWFDVMTAAPGQSRLIAIAMAACPELPVAALCAALALRGAAATPDRLSRIS